MSLPLLCSLVTKIVILFHFNKSKKFPKVVCAYARLIICSPSALYAYSCTQTSEVIIIIT